MYGDCTSDMFQADIPNKRISTRMLGITWHNFPSEIKISETNYQTDLYNIISLHNPSIILKTSKEFGRQGRYISKDPGNDLEDRESY